MGWIGCLRCEKFRRDFVARTFALVRPFCTEFHKASKRPECTQMVRNAPKYQFRVQWGGSGAFVAKNSYATNGPECTQMVQNAPKHHLRVQWGGSGAFVAKHSDATSWDELLD